VNYIPGYPQSNDIQKIKNFGGVQSTRRKKKALGNSRGVLFGGVDEKLVLGLTF